MPQDSLLYAVGRLRMLGRNLLSHSQRERLLSAENEQEALNALVEMGYLQSGDSDVEQAAMNRALEAAILLRQLSPEPDTTEAFMLRNDAHNLKTLLKARLLGEEPEGLSAAGALPLEVLRNAVAERRYSRLPEPWKGSMEALEQRLALKPDPMLVDVQLDKAMYQLMDQLLKGSSSKAAKAWLKARADFVNLRAFLRLRGMQASLSLEDILVVGGSIDRQAFLKAAAQPQALIKRYRPYGRQIETLALQALEDRQALSRLEPAMEAHLRGLFHRQRMAIDSMDVLIDYLLRVEEEGAMLRLIFATKRNRLNREDIEERLRKSHG